MPRRSLFRNPFFIALFAGILGIAGLLAYLFFSSFTAFDTLVAYDADDYVHHGTAREWGQPARPVEPAAREHGTGAGNAGFSGADGLPAPAGYADTPRSGGTLDRLVETSLKNRVNRELSMFVAGRTLQQLTDRADPGSPVKTDLAYLHTLFDSVRIHLEKGKLDEAGLRTALQQGIAAVRDRRLTPAEFDRLVDRSAAELGVRIDPEELKQVLQRMRDSGQRAELKRLVQEEAGGIARAATANPVSRRLSVLMARQVFSRYKEKICGKLPRGMTCDQAAVLFERTMQDIVSERISNRDVGRLAGLAADVLIDRRITPREMEQLVVFITQAAR